MTTAAPQTESVPAERSLKKRALLATGFSVGGQVASQALRMLSNVILSRLLFPEAFGLVAIVRMLNIGLQMISDVGVRSAIIRSQRGEDKRFLDTAWTLKVLRGLLLSLTGALLAFPVAAFYETPALIPLVAVSALSPLLLGLQSNGIDLLMRDMKTGRLSAIDLAAQIASLGVTIGIAYAYRSVWALVLGGLAMTATRSVLSYTATAGPHSHFGWDREAAREIVSLGKWIILSTLITFLAMRLDVMALGKLVSLDTLGVYSIALTIAGVAPLLMGQIIGTVLLPALSESHRAGPETLARNFQMVLETLLPAALVLVLATACAAPAFFVYLYEARYHDAGWMVQLSMLALWFQLLQQISSRAMLALGDSRGLAMSNGVKLLVGASGLAAGFALAGLPGLILGMAAGALAGHMAVAWRLKEDHGLPSGRIAALYSLGGLVAGVFACAAPHWLVARLGFDADLVPLVTLGVGALTIAPLMLMVLRRVRAGVAG